MKETFFFDLDGTLIDPAQNAVPISTINALKRLKQQGHFCAVATGRSLPSLKESNIHTIIDWDGFVCSNGQQVFLDEKTALYQHYLDPVLIKKVVDYANKHHLNIQFQAEHSFLLREVDEFTKTAHSFFHEPIPTTIKNYENENIEMLMVYTNNDEHFKQLNKIEGLIVYPGQSTYCDIVSSTSSKHVGIVELLKAKFKDPHDYIAFGDSTNDQEMLDHAKHSIAMGNANSELKKTADIITRSVQHDGIYSACMIYNWI